MPGTAIDDSRLTALGLLTEACQGLQAVLTPQLAEHGLSMTEFEVLLRLVRSPGEQLRMSDLSAQTSLSTSGITRVVDRLEREGLVERVSCATDRRGFWATVTAAGHARIEAVLAGHLALIDRWFTGLLDAEQLAALTAALRRVRDAVRPEAVAGVEAASASAVGGPARV